MDTRQLTILHFGMLTGLLAALFTSGCADGGFKCIDDWNRRDRGAAIGGVGGAAVGGLVGSQSGNAGAGALVGGAAGAGAGALIGNELDKDR